MGPIERLNKILEEKKNKSIFLAVFTIFFILVLIFVVIRPAFISYYLQKEDNEKRDKLSALISQKSRVLEKLILEKEQKKDTVDFLKELIPNKIPQAEFLRFLQKSSEGLNLELNGINFSEKLKLATKGISSTTFTNAVTLNYTGDLSDLNLLFKRIEESKFIFSISNFGISPRRLTNIDANTDPSKTHQLSLTLNFYWEEYE